MTNCLLCKIELEPSMIDGLFNHPEREDCLVSVTDHFGIAVDSEASEELLQQDVPASDFLEELDIKLFPPVEDALMKIFGKYGIERLGGASTGFGWTAFSTYQRCPYLFRRRYVEPINTVNLLPATEPEARAVGTVIHSLLAVYYTRMIDESYPLTPELLRDEMLQRANPEFINEGWRVFLAYSLYYQDENIMPLAVEYDLRDPRTKESCRFDLIAFFPESHADRAAGTYNVEHKSAGRFDDATLNGWGNDGEVLGQQMLWERMKLGLRFGQLKGTIVNILGKQKEPKFHRTTVAPETWQTIQHARDLKKWEAYVGVARATNVWPRARGNCIGRWGKCDLFEFCMTSND